MALDEDMVWHLDLRLVVLWSLLLQPGEKGCLSGTRGAWALSLKAILPSFPSPQDMFDKTKSGRIDVYGFSALWKFIQQWKNLFQQYDRDHSGSISYTELQQGEGHGGTQYTGRARLFSLLPTTEQELFSTNAALNIGPFPTPSVTWLGH